MAEQTKPVGSWVGTSFMACTMMSTLFSRNSSSRSSVHSDLPVDASVWRSVTLLVSPRFVWEGCVEVVRVLWVVRRREVKRLTWASARAEERVPIRSVRGAVEGGFEA